MPQFVALIQQGIVLDQKVVAVGDDEHTVLAAAQAQAEKLNAEQTGEAEAYSAVAVELPAALPSSG